ncbi:hypothetical protein [Bradyrhizobium sp. LA2.1]|uniref:hypothetical protein n=1 Tax=Bradyrhizobium sp. LA2.1 TaxID=3156376 RepID=UPI003395AC1F
MKKIGVFLMAASLLSASAVAQSMRPAPEGLKDDAGNSYVDRKARAFLILAPKIGEDNANLAIALILNEGLQIVGERKP